MKFKRLLIAIGAIALLTGLSALTLITGCTKPAEESTWDIKLQTDAALETDQKWLVATYFAERVDYYTEGRVVLDLRPAGELCTSRTALEAVSTGAVSAVALPAPALAGGHPEVLFELVPGVVPTGYKDLMPILDAGVGDIMDNSFAKDNVKLACYYTVGANCCSTAKNGYLKTPEDFKGLKVAGPGPLEVEILSALGAGATQIPSPDMYTSLQTGLIDAAITGVQGSWSDKLYEVAPYWTYYGTDLIGEIPFAIIFSLDLWNTFPEDIQEGIMKASRDVTENVTRDFSYPEIDSILKQLADIGITVERLTPAERDALQAITQEPARQWFLKTGGDLAAEIVDICTQYYESQ